MIQLAELYLKSFDISNAIQLYRKLRETDGENNELIEIRLVEALIKNGEEQEALELITKSLKSKTINQRYDKELLRRAAFITWHLRSFQYSVELCQRADDLIENGKDSIRDIVRTKNSLLFYKIEFYREKFFRGDYQKFASSILNLEKDVNYLDDIEINQEEFFTHKTYDTLAYYYLEKGNVHIDTSEDAQIKRKELEQAIESHKKATLYIDKCFISYNKISGKYDSIADNITFEYGVRRNHIIKLGKKIERLKTMNMR